MKSHKLFHRYWRTAILASLAVLTFAKLSACGGGGDGGATVTPSPPEVIQPNPDPTPVTLSMEKVAAFAHAGGLGAAEISAFDPLNQRLFVVNGAQGSVDVLSMLNTGTAASPTLTLSLVGSLTTAQFAANMAGVNSVAVRDGIVALAVEAATKTNTGLVAFVRASDLRVLGTVTVGALPDMLTFTPNGRYLLVANEGEPNSYGQPDSVDPEGSISIIELAGLSPTASTLQMTVSTADFSVFNSQRSTLEAQGVRLFGPGASVAQDLEPEYIAVASDSSTAWITLQENNAVAVLNIASKTITSVRALGLKDHSIAGQGLDASDEDGGSNTNSGTASIKITTYLVKGMYMPDGIAAFNIGTRTFLATANEGDAREYTGINTINREDPRVRDYCTTGFDSSVFGALTSTIGFDSNLGRLRITTFPGAGRTGKNAAGQCNELVAFGARSFSLWDASTVNLVWDSGDQFEQRTAALNPTPSFNASNDNNTFDNRSPAKGPEPESVVIGQFGTKTFAFVGLERVGGVMVYDVSNPSSPSYVTYLNTRSAATGDRGPEGLLFVSAANSPTRRPLLIVANETSGTTAVFQINLQF
jgi:DNA-binding beta-propeller fold protein YncE